MNKKLLLPIISIVVTIILALILGRLSGFSLKRESKEVVLPVIITSPGYGSLEKDYRLSGYIESETTVTILPKISGTLLSLKADVGDSVSRGTVVAHVDSESYELTLKQAEASYLSSKSVYERMERLHRENAVSEQDYDKARFQYEAYKSQYELALLNYNYTNLTSPIEGVILIKHASAGELVAPNVPVFTVGNLNKLLVRARIPEKYYHLFMIEEKNIKVTIDVPALDRSAIPLELRTIAPYISPETKNFEVVCDLNEQVDNLRPGMFIYINFTLDRRDNIYYLPFDTLVAQRYIWYVDEENRARELEIELGFFNNNYFQLPESYKDYKIIIDGQHFLKRGQPVRINN